MVSAFMEGCQLTSSNNDFVFEFGLVPVVMPLKDVRPYERNSRVHGEKQIAEIAGSIKEFGFKNPLIIDQNNVIRAGHGRYLAAKKLGMDRVPCLKGDLTETQWKAFVIADNRIAEKSTWNMELLQSEIQNLKDFDFNTELLGFNDADFFASLQNQIDATVVANPNQVNMPKNSSREISESAFEEFEHECPKCGFGWND